MTVLTAANALRNHVAFRNTSLRHLSDFLEQVRNQVTTISVAETREITALFLLVLRGRGNAESTFPLVPGQTFWMGLVSMLRAAVSGPPFIAGPHFETFTFTIDDVPKVRVTSTTEDFVVLPITVEMLRAATVASTSFGASVDFSELLHSPKPFTLLDLLLGRDVNV
jgi:hypothetical protein